MGKIRTGGEKKREGKRNNLLLLRTRSVARVVCGIYVAIPNNSRKNVSVRKKRRRGREIRENSFFPPSFCFRESVRGEGDAEAARSSIHPSSHLAKNFPRRQRREKILLFQTEGRCLFCLKNPSILFFLRNRESPLRPMMRAPLACTFKLTDFYFQKNTPLLHVWELATPPRYHPKLFFCTRILPEMYYFFFVAHFRKRHQSFIKQMHFLIPRKKYISNFFFHFPTNRGLLYCFLVVVAFRDVSIQLESESRDFVALSGGGLKASAMPQQ